MLEPYRFNARERTARALAAWEKGRPEETVAPLDSALRLQPGDPLVEYNAGTAHLAASQPDAAQLLEQAAKHAPPELAADALYNLGNARLRLHGSIALARFDVPEATKADAALLYWIIGTQIGKAYAQNAHGDVLGHVRDLGADFRTNSKARGYQTRMHLPFHADSTDVVGLLCLNKSKSGGASRIVSSTAIYNEMLARRPDLWALMCETFCLDRRGEEPAGQKPYYTSPCFQTYEGRVFVRYNRTYVESAQRFDGVPQLTAAHREAFDLMDALCNDPAFYLDMEFEPGDMQFVSNYTVLHSRAAYEDWPEPERKRHLLRLWLNTPGFARLPPSYADRSGDIVPTPRAHNMLFITLFAAFTAVFVACHAWTITRSAD